MHGHFFCQLNILNIAKGIYKSFQDIGLMPWYYMKPKQRITEKSFDESIYYKYIAPTMSCLREMCYNKFKGSQTQKLR